MLLDGELDVEEVVVDVEDEVVVVEGDQNDENVVVEDLGEVYKVVDVG